MPFKPNYGQQRAERNRAKEAKKLEKLQRQEEKVAQRKAAQEAGQDPSGEPEDS